MKDRLRAIVIGLFVIGALCIITLSLIFLRPRFGDGHFPLKVRFPSIEKISVGTRVTFAGKPVGQVIQVYPVEDARHSAKDGIIFAYELLLALDSHVKVYTTDKIQAQTSGLLGERTIAITPQATSANSQALSPNDLVYSYISASVEDTVQTFGRLAFKAESLINNLDELLVCTSCDIKTSLSDIAQAAQAFKSLAHKSSDEALLTNLSSVAQNTSIVMTHLGKLFEGLNYQKTSLDIQSILEHTRHVLAALDQPGRLQNIMSQTQIALSQIGQISARLSQSWPKVEQAIDSLASSGKHVQSLTQKSEEVMQRFELIAQHIYSGKGTLGRLAMKDDLFLNISQVLARANILMSDINNFGLMFHSNRTWKRQRSYQMDKLQSLKDPQAFERYWSSQLQTMHMNLAQLSSMLESAKQKRLSPTALGLGRFDQAFAGVIRELGNLQEQLCLFREQIQNGDQSPADMKP